MLSIVCYLHRPFMSCQCTMPEDARIRIRRNSCWTSSRIVSTQMRAYRSEWLKTMKGIIIFVLTVAHNTTKMRLYRFLYYRSIHCPLHNRRISQSYLICILTFPSRHLRRIRHARFADIFNESHCYMQCFRRFRIRDGRRRWLYV